MPLAPKEGGNVEILAIRRAHRKVQGLSGGDHERSALDAAVSIETGGNYRDLNLVAHLCVQNGAKANVRVGVDPFADDLDRKSVV